MIKSRCIMCAAGRHTECHAAVSPVPAPYPCGCAQVGHVQKPKPGERVRTIKRRKW